MIEAKTIQYLATKNQTTQVNIVREYCQHLFLSIFYQQELTDKILFKGGTALKIIYNSPRYSEDLDFSANGLTVRKIEDVVNDVLVEISKTNFEIDIGEAKKTTWGYLVIVNFRFLSYSLDVKMDVSLRDQSLTKDVYVISNDYMPDYTLFALRQDKIVTGKLDALLTRAKPRDWYDLYFMFRKGLMAPKDKQRLVEIAKELEKSQIDFSRELKIYLPRSVHAIIKDFKRSLLAEIKRYLVGVA